MAGSSSSHHEDSFTFQADRPERITIIRIAGNEFVGGWQNWDMLGLMQQINEEPKALTYIAANTAKAKGSA